MLFGMRVSFFHSTRADGEEESSSLMISSLKNNSVVRVLAAVMRPPRRSTGAFAVDHNNGGVIEECGSFEAGVTEKAVVSLPPAQKIKKRIMA